MELGAPIVIKQPLASLPLDVPSETAEGSADQTTGRFLDESRY